MATLLSVAFLEGAAGLACTTVVLLSTLAAAELKARPAAAREP